jgi:hypothetical protein
MLSKSSDRGIEDVDYEVTDDLRVLVRYQFSTADGSEWSVPLRPAAVLANCEHNRTAAFELDRYEVIAERLVRRGMAIDDVREMLEGLCDEILGEVRDDLAETG